jgi:hypothetical protein
MLHWDEESNCVHGAYLIYEIHSSSVLCFSVPGMVKSKGKVVSVLFLTEHHAIKTYWGVEL